MKAFSNENIIDKLCGGCDCQDFAPSVTYAISGSTLTVTDATTYETGAARSIVNIAVYDKAGGKVVGNIASDDGDDAVAISLATLDLSEGITILGTVVSDGGCISDGHGINYGATSGELGFWDKDFNGMMLTAVASS